MLCTRQNKQLGLNRRVEDVLARAALPWETEPTNTWNAKRSTAIIKTCSARDSTATSPQGARHAITHFKFLKAATLSRFPDYKPEATANH